MSHLRILLTPSSAHSAVNAIHPLQTIKRCISFSNPRLCDLGPIKHKDRSYFDIKTFRKHLRRQKAEEMKHEERRIAETFAKPPPAGWTIGSFLQNIEIGENWEEIEAEFKNWNQFISSTQEEINSMNVITNRQKRLLWKYINLYNHDLWPKNGYETYMDKFQAKPLENEGKPWTQADDEHLIQLAEYYDVSFGDPWIYISWEMQKEISDVQKRYTDIVIIPKHKSSHCDIAITKASRPLSMNRYFKLDPPIVYVIPSNVNFPLKPCTFQLPPHFAKYRKKECFRETSGNLS